MEIESMSWYIEFSLIVLGCKVASHCNKALQLAREAVSGTFVSSLRERTIICGRLGLEMVSWPLSFLAFQDLSLGGRFVRGYMSCWRRIADMGSFVQ